MSWQERRCNAEGFGRPEPFFFLCEERTYSPPARRAGGGIPPFGRAVRSARRIALSAESASQCRRACGRRASLPVRRNCVPFLRLRKPATGSFAAEMDDAVPHGPFSFACAKRNKSAPCGEQKGREPLWRSIIWKLRS